MKANILSTSHTIEIDKVQLDIFYFFSSHTMEVYIEGELFIHATFNPSRVILSYTNIIDIAVLYYDTYNKKKLKQEKLQRHENQE